MQVIKYGRFFRLNASAFVVVGRNEDDNFHLESLQQEGEWKFAPVNCMGPVALAVGPMEEPDRKTVASILARYSDRPATGSVDVEVRLGKSGEPEVIGAEAAEPEAAGVVRV